MAATAFERQALPIITNAAAPEVDTDEVAKLLSLFDFVLDRHRAVVAMCASVRGAKRTYAGALVDIDPRKSPYAEYAARLWCSANQLVWDEKVHEYLPCAATDWKASTIRAVRVKDHDDGEVIHIAWPREAVVEVTAAAVVEALRAPHWTDDKTLTDEERAAREQMEAGHA